MLVLLAPLAHSAKGAIVTLLLGHLTGPTIGALYCVPMVDGTNKQPDQQTASNVLVKERNVTQNHNK